MARSQFAVILPWWTGFVLAALVFVLVGYVAPAIAPSNRPAQALLGSFSRLAWLFALPFALLSIALLVRGALRRRLLDGQRDLDSIRALPWQEFEHLVGEAFRRQGFRVEERGGAVPDGGVDLVLHRDGRKAAVQCKRWRTRQMGVAMVRELYGAMTAETADEAILVSSGDYTADARRFADGKPIRLFDGPDAPRDGAVGAANDEGARLRGRCQRCIPGAEPATSASVPALWARDGEAGRPRRNAFGLAVLGMRGLPGLPRDAAGSLAADYH